MAQVRIFTALGGLNHGPNYTGRKGYYTRLYHDSALLLKEVYS